MKKIITLFFALSTMVGVAQNGIDFDGSNDYIQTTYPGITGTANRTFEAWIYLSSSPSSNVCILDYGLNAVGSRNTFYVTSTNKLGFISGGTNANIGSTNNNAVPIGQWAHVAFVLDNGTGYLYVNGSQVGTGSLTTVNTPAGNNNLKIGERVTGGSIPFDGVIDEVRIWNTALSQADIQANMNNEYCVIPTNLTAYYKLNSGVAGGNNTGVTTAIDEVASNNGTLINFSLSGTSSNWVSGASLTSGSGTPSNASITSCGPYTANTGQVWSTSGNYTDTISTPTGCDSVVNVTLTVKPNSTNSITATGCNKYTGPSGNQTWTTSGTVYDTLPSANGCDSILTIALTINTIDTTVLANGVFLTSYANNATYQWLDCNNGFMPIAGATAQTYKATANGSYAVEINDNGCIDTSACYAVTNVGIDENNFEKQVKVFPNPASNIIHVLIANNNHDVTVDVVDPLGKIVTTKTQNAARQISLPLNLPNGIYFVRITAGEFTSIKKITVL